MTTPSANLDYAVDFDPRDYLNEYYTHPDEEDRFIVRFMLQALQQMPPLLLALELGGGPTLYAVAALANQAGEIHFCDYAPANLAEVRRWLKQEPEAFDWRPYIQLALEEERQPVTPAAVAHRAAQMRAKLTRLLHCDALARSPLDPPPQPAYDLVVAQTSTDAVSSTIAEWRQVLKNISSLLKPGGWLLISVITGADEYRVGELNFPCLALTEADIKAGYQAAGYDLASLRLEKLAVTGQRDYSGLITAAARKST